MAVTLAQLEDNKRCAALDLEYGGRCMDFMTPEGFVNAVFQVLRLSPGSSLTLAPVCSTWVWVSRGSTKRSRALPLGNTGAPSVRLGNLMVGRCALLLLLAAARGVWWVLEQPKGSLLEYHPAMQRVLRRIRVWRKYVRMADYAAASDKGTWLHSSRPEIEDLDQFKPRRVVKRKAVALVDHYVDSKGKHRVKGNSQLKVSQAYTQEFGRAMAQLRSKHSSTVKKSSRAFLRKAAAGSKEKRIQHELSFWAKHADLDPVFTFLTS
ncbi:unnamed protein product [Durusdinium trenchii]|uniref:Uncharacterized protein n=2 Tax=Durusdinium trenchii TaxID=1381693 RepID=A0ABP0T239_9DINO